jgi:hypothetical protein
MQATAGADRLTAAADAAAMAKIVLIIKASKDRVFDLKPDLAEGRGAVP